MLTPIRLLLVRHGQSMANLDKRTNLTLPDCAVPLSAAGHEQAPNAGVDVAEFLAAHPPQGLRVLVSPYLRARQTAKEITECLDVAGMQYSVREALALREIEFGAFDGVMDEDLPVLYPREYAHYQKHLDHGKEAEIFARMPQGESRADVADRVRSVFGTILRDADPSRKNPIRTFVIVSHGVTIRAFRMQWLHHAYEWFAAQPNPNNCSVQLVEGMSGEGYVERKIFPGYPSVHSAQARREETGSV